MAKNKAQLQKVNMSKLPDLLEDAMSYEGFQYLVVVVKTPAAKAPEIIINPRENFAGKVDYYMSAYDNDGHLNNNPNVKIIAISFAQRLQDVMNVMDEVLS